MTDIVYLASWTQQFIRPFTGEASEYRATQHVDGEQFDLLHEDPMVLDLRSIEVTRRGLLFEPDDDEMRWLQGGRRWPASAPRCGRTDVKNLAQDVIALLPADQGGSQVSDDPAERRHAFAQHLALLALATAGQPGTALDRARRITRIKDGAIDVPKIMAPNPAPEIN